MMTRRGTAWLCAATVAAATTAALATIRPQVGYDAGLGLIACEQHLAGRPNSLLQVGIADPSDLSRDTVEVISWWPPGQQMIFCALRRAGLPFDAALRGLVLAAWCIGLAAWAAYFVRVLGPTAAAAWTIGLFALFRQSHAGVLVYSGGEALVWALCPVVVLLNLRALDRSRARTGPPGLAPLVWATAAGTAAALLILLKYSAAFITIGLAASWVWSVWRRDARARQLVAWIAGAAIGAAIAIAAGLTSTLAAGTPATSIERNPMAIVALWVLAGPAIGLSGTLAAMQTLATTLHVPVLGRFSLEADERRALAIAAIAWLVLLAAWARATRPALIATTSWISDGRRSAWRIAGSVAVATSLGLAAVLARGGTISFEDRHLQYGGFLLLPFLVKALADGWALRRVWPRTLAATVAVLAVGVPAVTGTGNLASEVLIRPPDASRPAALGVDRVLAADLDAQPWVATAVLATTPTLLPVARPSQRVLWIADSDEGERADYRGTPAGGVALVLPASASAARSAAIRRTFRDVRSWERVPLDHVVNVQLWRGR